PSDRLAGVLDQLLGICAGTVSERDRSHPLLTPGFARPPGHDHIGDRRMRRDRHLDFLGEDLLATRVDGHRVPAEQLDGTVLEMTRTVARYSVPHAVDDGESGRRLGRVPLIAQRHIAFLSEPADAFVAKT